MKKKDKNSLETNLVKDIRSALPEEASFAYLFGSAAQGHLLPESDIDIAVFFHPCLSIDLLRQTLTENLERKLGRTVDLIILNQADPIIVRQVLTSGALIHERDHKLTTQFKAAQMSLYIDFKRSREPIEKTLMQKGWPVWNKKMQS